MATRERQIEAIAGIIHEAIAFDPEGVTLADVEATNRLGWTIELTASDGPHSGNVALDRRAAAGRVVRYEGVVLSAKELGRAWDLALAMGAA